MPLAFTSCSLQGLQRPAAGLQPACRGGRHRACALRAHNAAPPQYDTLGGPGTGTRHYPEDLGQQYEPPTKAPPRGEPLKSTLECYEAFPYQVHVAMPLRVEDREPAGVTVEHTPDAGPATGHRRRPGVADPEARQHPPRLPDPAAPKDLKRELVLRHHPEEVLRSEAGP